MTPTLAAQPALSRLVHEPSLKYSNDPDAIVPAMPIAFVMPGLSRPIRRAAAAAAPKAPATPVG